MALIRNISPDDRVVPALGWKTVTADSVVEVPDDLAESFTCQEAIWSDASAPATPAASDAPAAPSEG